MRSPKRLRLFRPEYPRVHGHPCYSRYSATQSPEENVPIFGDSDDVSPIHQLLIWIQVYKGASPILLSSLILEPQHSILTQSYDSRLRLDTRRPHNGDGFGVGYYTPPSLGPTPCIFTSTIPAWNCINLERLATKTTSSLIFAHVRATTEGSLSDSNCHPFRNGRLMWMHNGNIGCWNHVKRAVAMDVDAKWFNGVQGNTDSEWAFALFLDSLQRAGCDPNSLGQEGDGGFGHKVLREAVLTTIRRINAFIKTIPEKLRNDEDTRSLLNFAVTDGQSVICTRYVTSATDEAASLYFSSGTSWKEEEKGTFKMERRDKGADIVLVASEPLTFERGKLCIFVLKEHLVRRAHALSDWSLDCLCSITAQTIG